MKGKPHNSDAAGIAPAQIVREARCGDTKRGGSFDITVLRTEWRGVCALAHRAGAKTQASIACGKIGWEDRKPFLLRHVGRSV